MVESKIQLGRNRSNGPSSSRSSANEKLIFTPEKRRLEFDGGVLSLSKPAEMVKSTKSNTFQQSNISPALRNLLQKPFTSALMSPNPQQREKFFSLLVQNFSGSGKLSGAAEKLRTVFEYNWEPVAHRFWLPQASGFLLSGIAPGSVVELGGTTPGFETFLRPENRYTQKHIEGVCSSFRYNQYSESSKLVSSQAWHS